MRSYLSCTQGPQRRGKKTNVENVDLLKKTLELGKKPNMAASGINTAIEEAILMLSEESQEEPSLLEIKNILILF